MVVFLPDIEDIPENREIHPYYVRATSMSEQWKVRREQAMARNSIGV
jgi:hypothetical protein